MLRSLKAMHGYAIQATDGEVGHIRDFFFDDSTWHVRYLIDDTGNWLPGRRVLISTTGLGEPDWRNESFHVRHTKEQIENGPGIETDQPVSRQMEARLFEHFQWMPYWAPLGSADPAGMIMPPVMAAAPVDTAYDGTDEGDPHLQSLQDVFKYYVEGAGDGENLGHIADMIVDDQRWQIVSVILDTGTWLRGKQIELPTDRVRGIVPDEGKILIDVSRGETETCEPFNLTQFASEQLEAKGEFPDFEQTTRTTGGGG